jgi:hypothetical protein
MLIPIPRHRTGVLYVGLFDCEHPYQASSIPVCLTCETLYGRFVLATARLEILPPGLARPSC